MLVVPSDDVLQAYREILAGSYESLTQGGVSKLRNVMMELRKAVSFAALLVCLMAAPVWFWVAWSACCLRCASAEAALRVCTDYKVMAAQDSAWHSAFPS